MTPPIHATRQSELRISKFHRLCMTMFCKQLDGFKEGFLVIEMADSRLEFGDPKAELKSHIFVQHPHFFEAAVQNPKRIIDTANIKQVAQHLIKIHIAATPALLMGNVKNGLKIDGTQELRNLTNGITELNRLIAAH